MDSTMGKVDNSGPADEMGYTCGCVYNGIKQLWTGKWNDNGYTGIQGARKTQNVLLKAFLCTLFMTFGLKGMLDSIRKEPTEWRTCCMSLKLLSILESDKIGDFLSSKWM